MTTRTFVFLALAWLAACNSADSEPDPECGPNSPCPDGFRCGGDGRCQLVGMSVADPPPEVVLEQPAAGATTGTSVTVTFAASGDGVTFECRMDDGEYEACTSPESYDLPAGLHTVSVRAITSQGARGVATRRTFTVVATPPPPATTIAGTPADGALTRDTTASLSFSSVPGATFACSLDQAPMSPCRSPLALLGLGEGAHTFAARASLDGVVGAEANLAWTVDTTPPVLRMTERPTDPSQAAVATFAFDAGDAGDAGEVTTRCSLDRAPLTPCRSPLSHAALADGTHTFVVEARDAAGNTASTSYAWAIDTLVPAVAITDAPADPSHDPSPSFAFSAADGVTRCSLDAASPAPCGSPHRYEGLAEGAHTFVVEAVDAAGNVGSASTSWTVDFTAPVVTLTDKPPAVSNMASPSFSFRAEGTTRCALDGGGPAPCSSPVRYAVLADGGHTFVVEATDRAGNTGSATYSWTQDTVPPAIVLSETPADPSRTAEARFVFSGQATSCALDQAPARPCQSPQSMTVADGMHTFVVTAVDAAGNRAAASTTWRVDTQPPMLAITEGPAAESKTSSATFAFTADAATRCAVDGAPPEPCTSPVSVSGLRDGLHTFLVEATDAAGNTALATEVWAIDLALPGLLITAMPPGTSPSAAAEFAFTVDIPATTTCALDGAAPTPCASPVSYAGLEDGAHTFLVKATAEGKTGYATVGWTIDTVAPDVTVSGPRDPSPETSATFSFTASADSTTTCALDGATPAPCASPRSFAGLADGAHRLTIEATDAAGNVGSATYPWSIDTVPPTVSLDGPSNPSTTATATFTFAAAGTTRCALDGAPPAACASPATFPSLPDGPHVFVVEATDLAGNVGSASWAWTIDTIAPTVAISGPPDPSPSSSATFTFTAGGTTRCALDGAAPASCTSPRSVSGLADGRHMFLVQATDSAGNLGSASYGWTIDTVAPTVSLSGPPDPSNSPAPRFTFTAGGATRCSLDGGTAAPCASPRSYAGLADGIHTFLVQATDVAGNVGSASQRWTIDTVPPAVTLTGRPPDPSASSSATFTFTAGAAPRCSLDGATPATCTSPRSYSGLADGLHTFLVQATDAAGNTGSASDRWTVATPLTVTITSRPPPLTRATSATVGFTVSKPATVECSLDSGALGACTTATSMSFSGLAPGRHHVTVQASDSVGGIAAADSGNWNVAFCVSAGGRDTAAGHCDAPFRSISRALAWTPAGQGDVIYVAPGAYDAAHGEVFPLAVPASVSLIGDEAHKGEGATPTELRGAALPTSTSPYAYTLSPVGAGATIAGLRIVGSFIPATVSATVTSIDATGDDVVIRNNTIADGMAHGLLLSGSGYSVIGNVITRQVGFGVFARGPGRLENNVVTANNNGISVEDSGADLGGGATYRSAGGNVISCNANKDIQIGIGAGTALARGNFWDHIPPTTSSICASGVDVCTTTGSLDTSGAQVVTVGGCP